MVLEPLPTGQGRGQRGVEGEMDATEIDATLDHCVPGTVCRQGP